MGMYDNDGFDFDDDNERRQPTAKDLRDLVRKANERASELEKQNALLSGKLAERNLKDVLTDKGLRPGLARVIAKEDVDLTDSKAVEAWLTDPVNQEDFGFSLEAGPAGEGDGQTVEGGEQDARAEQFTRMQNAGQNATPSGPGGNAATAIKQATSLEEINAAIAAGLAQGAH